MKYFWLEQIYLVGILLQAASIDTTEMCVTIIGYMEGYNVYVKFLNVIKGA